MTFDRVKISLIMSVYNGANELKRTIESVLIQTFKDFEFIIIDDFSNDFSHFFKLLLSKFLYIYYYLTI